MHRGDASLYSDEESSGNRGLKIEQSAENMGYLDYTKVSVLISARSFNVFDDKILLCIGTSNIERDRCIEYERVRDWESESE